MVELRGYLLEARMPQPIRNSRAVITARQVLVVELLSDIGISGWGETQEDPATAWNAVEALAPELFDTDPCEAVVYREPRTRTEALARSAVDLALWDLRGRLLGVPIAELLGGRRRDRVFAYASGPFLAVDGDPYAELNCEAEALLDEGFRALKPRIGVSPCEDAAAIGQLRGLLNADTELMVDVNRGYGLDAAAELLRRLDGTALNWVEEPIDSDDPRDYAVLTERSAVPLAAGEALWGGQSASAFTRGSGLAVLQPDLYLAGGLSGVTALASVAEEAGVAVIPHVFGSGINLAASLQLASALPEMAGRGTRAYPWLEFDRSGNPLHALPSTPSVNNGFVAVPDGPGLGIEPSREQFEPYLISERHVDLRAALA